MSSAWTITIDHEWIAWLTFDLPGEKVNKFTSSSMQELDEALDVLAADESIKAVAVRSAKPDSFIVGADIDEIARLKNEDEARAISQRGQAIFEKLATLPVPSVAVIDGACMGGGLEMALACTWRLVTDHEKTSLALPEVNLGILPGWGGTQRLPRLIGLPAALEMILTGKPASSRKAARCGLADGIIAREFAEDQVREFINRALTRTGRREILRRRKRCQQRLLRMLAATAPGRWLIYRRARKQIIKRTNGHYPAPLEALRVVAATYRRRPVPRFTREAASRVRRRFRGAKVQRGKGKEILLRPFEPSPLHPSVGSYRGTPFAVESDALAKLATSSTCRHLVWLFGASQRAKKGDRASADGCPEARVAGVVGAGVMGAGIAWALSNAEICVRLHDVNWTTVARGMRSAAQMNRALVDRRKMTEAQMNLAMHRIGPTTDYTGFADADVVIEAIVEDLEIKKKVLRAIEEQVRPDAIIATNTSSLPLNELAAALRHPRRFVGLHFFNPVNRMPLVEVVPCRKTSRQTIAAAAQLVRRIGKTPVPVGDCPGFLVNRILLPYLIEASWMFEEGADAEQIDRALERFGMPMGPLALVDEVGIDVGYKVAKVLEGAYGNRMHVANSLGRIAESGEFLGRKSGSGIYDYHNGRRKVNPAVRPLLEEGRRADGVTPRPLTDEQIVDRAVLVMVNEAARCLEEGVSDDPASIDLAMVLGTGFAPFRGGLLHYADDRGVAEIHDRLETLATEFGERFRPAPLIRKLAERRESFYANGNGRRSA